MMKPVRPGSCCLLALIAAAALAAKPDTPPASVRFSGNAHDFVVFFCHAHDLDMAIDPPALAQLSATTLELTADRIADPWSFLADQLRPAGLGIEPVELLRGQRIALLGAADSLGYSRAMSAVQRGDSKSAYAALEAVAAGDGAFAERCAELRRALDEFARRNQQFAAHETLIRQHIADMTRATRELDTARMAQRSRLGPGGSATQQAMRYAQDRVRRVRAEAEHTRESLRAMLGEMAESNQEIGRMFQTARDRQFMTEARLLLENLHAGYERFRALLDLMRSADLLARDEDLAPLSPAIAALRDELRRVAHEADNIVRLGRHELAIGDYQRAERRFYQAWSLDRSSTLARAGLGYCAMIHNRRSWDKLRTPQPADRAARIEELEIQFSVREQRGLLAALYRWKTDQPTRPGFSGPTRIGAANSLVISETGATPVPIIARLEPLPARTAPARPASTRRRPADRPGPYWEPILPAPAPTQDHPVTLGETSPADPALARAVHEAHTWLRTIDRSVTARTGLRIEMEEALAAYSGEADGAAIAIAAFSALRKAPVRQDVALSGMLGADGTLAGVNGLPLKIAGALAAGGIDLVIVPKENEPDLLTLPVEALCQLVIIVAGDMRACLKHALRPPIPAVSEEQRLTLDNIRRLREAQVALLLGDEDAAVAILVSLAGAYDEIYNIRRLLELFQARWMMQTDPDRALALRAAVEEVRARQPPETLPLDYRADEPILPAPAPPSPPTPAAPSASPEPVALPALADGDLVWQVLPFPQDARWSGEQGRAAMRVQGELILQARPVRARDPQRNPPTIRCEFLLEERIGGAGGLFIELVPEATPPHLRPARSLAVGFVYHDGTGDNISLLLKDITDDGRPSSQTLWRHDQTLKLDPDTWRRLTLVFGETTLEIHLDDKSFTLENILIPFDSFHIQLGSWPPTARWRVRNFHIE
jgi:hypothetical protein